MAKRRPAQVRRPDREKMRKAMSVIFSILFPPAGIVMIWRSKWSNRARYCLTGLAVGCAVLMVALLPSADSRVNGGVELIGREPTVAVYGPELPTAMVTGYVAPPEESVIYEGSEEEEIEYVYAMEGKETYHTSKCRHRKSSSQKLTPYEAYYLGYRPCKECKPPVYTPPQQAGESVQP